MPRLAWRKPLKIDKAERYSLDLNSSTAANPDRSVAIKWLSGDTITSFDIVAPTGSGVVVAGKTNTNGVLSCLISGGLQTGYVEIEFVFATSERSDCQLVRLKLDPACEASIDPDEGLFIQGGVLVADGVITTDSSVWG